MIYVFKKYSSFCQPLLLFLLICSILVGLFFAVNSATANADTYIYSNVLYDLYKDNSFFENNYPEDDSDYSIELIQIAESSGGELLVYVYNPQADSKFNAKMIRLSQSIGENFSPNDYKLTLVSSYGVFEKYVVDGVKVKSDTVRYYNIVCIFRDFIDGIDDEIESETMNYVTYIPYEVAKCYTAVTLNGNVTYTVEETQVVTITGKYVGFVRYGEGAYLWNTLTDVDRHFVAFSCDYDIERLYEADLVYSYHVYTIGIHGNGAGNRVDGETIQHEPITLYENDEGSNVGGGIFGQKFTWNRIETTDEFLSEFDDYNFEWTDGANIGIEDTQWVLSFAETDVSEYYSWSSPWSGGKVREATKIDEVSILRLKFLVDGEVLNLGVVDNYQGNASYESSGNSVYPDWLKNSITAIITFLIIALIIILLAIFAPWILQIILNIFLTIFKCIYKALKFIVKAIIWLLLLPFKGIKAIVNRARGEPE